MSNSQDVSVGLSHRAILTVLFGLIAGMFLGVLDQTVAGAALPTIVGDLNGVESMSLVITAYMLASAVVLPICGKLGDLFGHKRMFITAVLVFLVGSTMSALATNMTLLIIGRFVQGLGGGSLMVLAMAVMSHIAPPDKMRKYTPLFGLTFGVSFVVGPLIGGFLSTVHDTHIFGVMTNWRWVFWLNLPVGALALAAIVAFVPKLPVPKVRPKFDTYGIILLSLASTSIVLATTWGGSKYAWGSPAIIWLIVSAVVSAILFVIVERRLVEDPVMPLFLFKNRNFSLVTVAGLVLGVVMMGTLAYLPTYLQMATGTSATMSGVYMLPLVGGMLVVSNTVNIIITRTKRYKWAPLSGMAVMGVGLVLLSTLTATTAIWHICVYLGVMGAGMGMTMQTLMAIVRNEVPLMMSGTGNSTNIYFRTIGSALGASFIGSLFVTNLKDQIAERLPGASIGSGGQGSLTPAVVKMLPSTVRSAILESYSDALTPIFLWITPLVVVAFIVLLFLRETPFKTTLDYGKTGEMAKVEAMV
ncbi:MAG: MFS transporter [Candidatus Nomurabacteria bacterium]|nr:MAG: MFS transporter [Candidatus Nomurabacteria bacterium]